MTSKSVLIIDDDPRMLDLIIHYVESEDFDVMVAINGHDGVQLAESELPALILLDIAMPEMDGFATCELLKTSPKTSDIPIIFMTASSHIEEKVRGFEAGAVDYITKPFQYQELLARIKTHLQLRQLQSDLMANNAQLKKEIEQRREAEKKADEARIVAEQANQAKSTFLAMMSESLRLPLNTILGYSSLLRQERQLDEHHYEWLDLIQAGGKHLLAQVNDILDVSLLGKDKLILRTRPIPFLTFLDRIADATEQQARKKDLQFIYDKDKQLPAFVETDKKRLRQILDHLLNNAIKFTRSGWISLKIKKLPQALFRFEIEDSGIGIAKQDQKEIFKLFHSIENNGEQQQHTIKPGLGLGLSLSQHLLNQMGSKIQIRTEPGKGSLFWFDIHLPIAQKAREEENAFQHVIGYEGANSNPRQVVIYDDIVENCFLLRDYLQPLGFQVTLINNMTLLSEYCQKQPPDIIFVELYGDDLVKHRNIEQLKKNESLKHLPIVALSSNSLYIEDTERQSLYLFNDVLIKPIDRNRLLDCIQQHLFLRWSYERKKQKKEADTENFLQHVPPQQKLRALYGLVQSNQAKQINAWSDRVGFLDPSYLPFTDKIKSMAEEGQFDEILDMLEELL